MYKPFGGVKHQETCDGLMLVRIFGNWVVVGSNLGLCKISSFWHGWEGSKTLAVLKSRDGRVGKSSITRYGES